MRDKKPLYKPGMKVVIEGAALDVGVIDEVRQRVDGVSYVIFSENGQPIGTYPESIVRLAWMPSEPNRAHCDDDDVERSALRLMEGGGSVTYGGDAVVVVNRTEHEDLFRVEVYRFEKWTLMAKPKK